MACGAGRWAHPGGRPAPDRLWVIIAEGAGGTGGGRELFVSGKRGFLDHQTPVREMPGGCVELGRSMIWEDPWVPSAGGRALVQ